MKYIEYKLKELIKQGERDIRVLSDLGNSKINLELSKIYKKEKHLKCLKVDSGEWLKE